MVRLIIQHDRDPLFPPDYYASAHSAFDVAKIRHEEGKLSLDNYEVILHILNSAPSLNSNTM